MTFERLERHKPTIWNCQVCSVCQRGPWNPYPPKGPTSDRLCPEYEKYRTLTHSALGRIQAVKWLLEGKYEPDEDFVKVVYDCLLCGACSTVGCVVDKEHVSIFRDLRSDLASLGLGPTEAFVKSASNIEHEGNRFGRPKSQRGKWAEELDLPSTADTVYFAGCVASYRSPQLAQATAKLLNRIGTEFTVLAESEACCGNPLVNSGQVEAFENVVKKNLNAFEKAGASRIVTSCACCYNVLKFDYPGIVGNLDFEVIHITESVANALQSGSFAIENRFHKKVAYQDPCHLARLGGRVIKEPRMVLKSIPGLELVEMEGSGKDTQCCGRYPVELPELSMLTGINRISDARNAGAETLVTACSYCNWNLNRAEKNKASGIRVADFVELMVELLGK